MQAVTAKDALQLWDDGQPVAAFQVETTPDRQAHVYGAAFELLRGMVGGEMPDWDCLEATHGDLSPREREVAKSIAVVANKMGWAKMVAQHIHSHSPATFITKPAAKSKDEGNQ